MRIITLAAVAYGVMGCSSPDRGVVLNEVSTLGGDFVELFHAGGDPVDLAGHRLRGTANANEHGLAGVLNAGEHLLVAEDLVIGLVHGGDTLELLDPAGAVVDTFTWADGNAAPSLGRVPDGAAEVRVLFTPTPGTANTDALPEENPSPFDVVINEVESVDADRIEIVSRAVTSISLDGFWYIDSSNNPDNPRSVLFAKDIEPGEHLVLTSHVFGLKREGDSVTLFDAENRLVDRVEWGLDQAAVSFCRIPDATGAFERCSEATFGAVNVP